MTIDLLKVFKTAKEDFHFFAQEKSKDYDFIFYLNARLMAKAAIDCKKLGLL